MQTDFLLDLDDYFCKKYANYTKICATEGYVAPNIVRADPAEHGLNDERYKLCYQADPFKLLNSFKENLYDAYFSFSFTPAPLMERIKDIRRKHTFKKILPAIFEKYALDINGYHEIIDISRDVWKNIVLGKYYPEKNTIYAIALTGGISRSDTADMLAVCGYEFDYSDVRDTVVSYLIDYKIYNGELIKAALNEYKIHALPLR